MTQAAITAERFFQFSLLGLVASGYLAVAGSGYLDAPTIVLTGAGLLLRALLVAGVVRLEISNRAVTLITLAYIGFFALDYLFLSRGFLEATVHLVFFLAVVKILTARTNRDYAYVTLIAFLELLAASVLSANLSFFAFLSLYLLFAMAAFTSSEIRRAVQKPQVVARSGLRRFHLRLAALTLFVTLGILSLTAGLFFMLPRTAHAAFDRLVSRRVFLPGFSSQVTLGEIGQVMSSSQPVMHIRAYRDQASNLKWRGAALSRFDGRKWFNPLGGVVPVPVTQGRATLGPLPPKLYYEVDLNAIDTDALFFAGIPQELEIRHTVLLRTPEGNYRLGRPGRPLRYGVYATLEQPPPFESPPGPAPEEVRARYLQLPPLDPRISELAARMTAGAASDAARARAIESALRRDYGYTLELPSKPPADPLAHFLFERRKGHCEYFASAMTVMLRTLGIPARLVNGFQSGTWNPFTEMFVVRASDAHSWVEAWLPGRGWTTYDPTPPDPNRRRPSLSSKLALYADAAETFWQEWVLGYDPNQQAQLADNVQRSGRLFGLRWFDELRERRQAWTQAAETIARRYGVPAAAGLAIAGLALWLGPGALRRLRVRRGVRRARYGHAVHGDATLLYLRMLEVLDRRGYHKPAWFTPREFAATLPPELGGLVAEFTGTYNAVRFGAEMEAAPQLSMLLEELEQTRT